MKKRGTAESIAVAVATALVVGASGYLLVGGTKNGSSRSEGLD
jgi:hypothetical protein